MLHDRRQRHRERLRQRGDRQVRLFGEPRQQRPPRRISKRGEGAIERRVTILNHIVKHKTAMGAVKRATASAQPAHGFVMVRSVPRGVAGNAGTLVLTGHGSVATLDCVSCKESAAGDNGRYSRALKARREESMTRIVKTMLLAGAMALPLGSIAVAQETGGGGGGNAAASVPIPTVSQSMLNNAASDSKNFLRDQRQLRSNAFPSGQSDQHARMSRICASPGFSRPTFGNRRKPRRSSSTA